MNRQILYISFILLVFNVLNLETHCQEIKNIQQLTNIEEPEFYHLRMPGGMQQNSITSVAQDTLGQMWFSTKDGLIRYNSKDFFTYKYEAENPHSIQSNFIGRVYIARNGSIWIRTGEGLSKFRPETDDFERISQNDGVEKNIFSMDEDSQGLIWFPGDNSTLYCYDDTKKELKSFKYDAAGGDHFEAELVHILITKEDRIFITTNQSYLLEFDIETSSFIPIQFINDKDLNVFEKRGSYAFAMLEDHEGHIWLVTHFGFLLKYDISNNSFSSYHYRENIDQLHFCTAMFLFEDDDHTIWVGSWADGLYEISADRNSVYHIMANDVKNTSLSNNIVTNAFQDQAAYMWFGTEFAGISILKKNKKFSVISNHSINGSSLPAYPYLDAAVDASNRVWIGTDGGGLYYFNREDKIAHHTGSSIIGDEIRVFCLLYDSQDLLWIGTGNGLFQYNPLSREVKHYPCKYESDYNSPGGRNIISLCEDKDGNIWMGSIHGGLTRFDVGAGRFYRFVHDDDDPNSLSYKYVSAIYCDSNNDVWVGTLDGLNKFNPISGNFTIFKSGKNNTSGISSNTVYCMYEKNGSLWIGTKGGGLNEYNLQTKNISYYLKEDGLPSNNVVGINSDEHGNLWISTTRNISKFNLQTQQFVNYSASDGLYNKMYVDGYGMQELEFYEKFARRDQDGYLYFGGLGGMFCFHPDSLPQNEYKPPIIIDKLLVNGESFDLNGTKEIILKPNQNHLEFGLTVLNFIQADKNQYAYYLENYDSAWVYKGTTPTVEYFDLPAGTYSFYYKGSNNDGLWSAAHAPLIIQIKPRFYQTLSFYVLLMALFVLLILSYVYYRWHIKKQMARQRQSMRYSQSNLDENEAGKINSILTERLEDDELFLEADLSLHKLAKILDTSPHYLSQVINQYHQRNFHEFINMYRIKMAKKLLTETQLKIEAVAYDSGFNSISTFNVAFKKETGFTPSAFRKKNQ